MSVPRLAVQRKLAVRTADGRSLGRSWGVLCRNLGLAVRAPGRETFTDTYWDTPDRRLLAGSIRLRLRDFSSGPRAGECVLILRGQQEAQAVGGIAVAAPCGPGSVLEALRLLRTWGVPHRMGESGREDAGDARACLRAAGLRPLAALEVRRSYWTAEMSAPVLGLRLVYDDVTTREPRGRPRLSQVEVHAWGRAPLDVVAAACDGAVGLIRQRHPDCTETALTKLAHALGISLEGMGDMLTVEQVQE
ncbi:MAG: CYTH domain-containing protein [Armatimonadetes bacterium]|nr:CYTH domain-containing protein [Armatimonadota bacterium]